MQTALKRTLAMLLAALMLCSGMTAALAAPEAKQDAEVSYGSQNALGQIVQNLSDDGGEDGYAISYLAVQDGTVKAYVENKTACTLVTAAYDEVTAQMLSVGVAEIEADAGTAEVTMDAPLPEYYVMKAFLLDSESHAALCKNYESREQTRAFRSFLDKHPEDFRGDTVLVFDDEKEIEDFAVLTDDVQAGKFTSSMTYSYDEASNAYTFKNAAQEIKNLKKGDLYYYPAPDGEYLLFKVKEISVSGSTVTVTQDADVGMDELFTFIRIDAEGDYDRMDGPRQEDMPEGVTLIENDVNAQWSGDVGAEFRGGRTVLREISPDTGVLSGSARGQVSLAIQVSVHLFYDIELFGDKYFNFLFKAGLSVGVSASLSGGVDLTPLLAPKRGFKVPVGSTGVFVRVKPAVVLRVSLSVSFSAQYSCLLVVTADSDNGLRNGKSSAKVIQNLEAEHEEQVEIVIGVRDEAEVFYLIDSANLVVGVEGGIRIVGTFDHTGVVQDDAAGEMLHTCDFCIDGEIYVYGLADLAFNFKLGLNKWSLKVAEGYTQWKLQDFYFSNKLGFGEDDCPNRLYALHVVVWEGNQLKEGARVVCASAVCDADGDGKYNETETVTDADGKADFFGNAGAHTVMVEADGYEAQEQTAEIKDKEQTLVFFLRYYTLHVTVTDQEDGKALADANVSVEGGRCDADGDGEYNESSMTTGADGKAVFRVPTDAKPRSISVSKSGYKSKSDSVYVVKDGQTMTIRLEKTDDGVIEFGSYPQSAVTDAELIAMLNAQPQTWKTCDQNRTDKWYNEEEPLPYMMYTDVTYPTDSGQKYRGVKLLKYDKYGNLDESASNIVNWYKWESLRWIVLDDGIVLCESIIDTKPFNYWTTSMCYDEADVDLDEDGNEKFSLPVQYIEYGDQYEGGYTLVDTFDLPDEYGVSFIREWLNNEFYQTAFNSVEKSMIIPTTLDNTAVPSPSWYHFLYGKTRPATTDNVFLLSLGELPHNNLNATGSDYAYKNNERYPYDYDWMLRTVVGDFGFSTYSVDSKTGNTFLDFPINFGDGTDLGFGGVRPAIQLNLDNLATQASTTPTQKVYAQANAENSVQAGQRYPAFARGTIEKSEYILLVRRAGTTGLTAENLLYIDQQTASGGEISFTYNPRMSGDAVVEIIGDFGSGIETRTPEKYENPRTISVAVETVTDSGSIVTGAGTYNVGDTVTLTARPQSKERLDGWYVDGKCVSADAVYTFTAEKDMTVKAVFTHKVIGSVTVADKSTNAKDVFDLSPVVEDNGTAYTLTYASSNPKVAAVDKDGKVTTGKRGTATITVTATDEYGIAVSDTCTVTVKYTFLQWLIIIFLFGWIWYV